MPRDYKKRATVKAAPKRKSPAWHWWLVGLILIGFLAVLYGLGQQKTVQPTQSSRGVTPAELKLPPKLPVKPPNPAPHKPRFEFYNTLPKQEIRVPPVAEQPLVIPTPPEEKSAISQLELNKGRYNVQIGSYTRTVDAEKLRAELAFLGIETRIQAVTLKKTQQRRYRVIAGPFQGKQRVQNLRRQLRTHGYPDVLVLTQR